MWSRGSAKNNFRVEVHNGSELVATREGFASAAEADRWGEAQQRKLWKPEAPADAAGALLPNLSDDQLLQELGL